jgi:periplasmic divalent cation tolerance protein
MAVMYFPVMALTLAYITCPDIDEARRIGRTLVLERLAACVNILPRMESFYWWNGKIENDHETVLLAKLPEQARESLLARVIEIHPYDTPCVLFTPVTGGNPDYLDWLASEADGD